MSTLHALIVHCTGQVHVKDQPGYEVENHGEVTRFNGKRYWSEGADQSEAYKHCEDDTVRQREEQPAIRPTTQTQK